MTKVAEGLVWNLEDLANGRRRLHDTLLQPFSHRMAVGFHNTALGNGWVPMSIGLLCGTAAELVSDALGQATSAGCLDSVRERLFGLLRSLFNILIGIWRIQAAGYSHVSVYRQVDGCREELVGGGGQWMVVLPAKVPMKMIDDRVEVPKYVC